MKVALATCRVLPEPDADEPLLLEALTRSGVEARVLAWDDPAAPFAEQDLVILRSTWNYHQDVRAFLAWVDATARVTRLMNPADVVRWNATKTYLRELDERGIAIVPTRFVSRGEKVSVGSLAWPHVVIKPTISAGSFRTKRFDLPSTEAQAFLDELSAERDVMVQPWMPTVDTSGERSLVWIAGEITHAIRKTPRFADGHERVSDAVPIADDERAFAHAILAPLASRLLYARVDMLRDAEGVLRVMELELVEPSLFFTQFPAALGAFAKAVVGSATHG